MDSSLADNASTEVLFFIKADDDTVLMAEDGATPCTNHLAGLDIRDSALQGHAAFQYDETPRADLVCVASTSFLMYLACAWNYSSPELVASCKTSHLLVALRS